MPCRRIWSLYRCVSDVRFRRSFIDALQKANIAGQAARQFITDVLDPAIDAFRKLIAPYKEN